MQRILIPLATKKTDQTNIAINFIRETYVNKLVRLGLVPVFVSPLMRFKDVDQLYGECHGALFAGGGDINASYYHQKNHPQNDRLEPARDKLELYLASKILKDKKPFLGICRGCQVLAVASGGTLHQYLPDLELKENHSLREYGELFNKNNGHEIHLDKASRAFKIIGKLKLRVNSAHHQAVKSLGKNLAVSARSGEGIIEIIEHTDPKYFCFGLQCHPEAMNNASTDNFFAEFAKATRAGK